MNKLIILAFIAIASCATKQNNVATHNTTTSVQEGDITLTLHEKIQVGDLQIHFKEVLEDSRCPTGTNCFWQGRAKILVETSEDQMTVDRSEIIFGELKTGEEKNHTFYKSGNTIITAIAIKPYPTSETGTTGLDYKLHINVLKE